MRKFLIPCIVFIFTSCIDESQLKPVVPFSLIHGNSSKVWLLDEIEYPSGEVLVSQIHQNKLTYTFFSNQSFVIQKLIQFGTPLGEKGTFNCYIDQQDTIFRMDYKNRGKELFKIQKLSNESFYFQSLKSENIYRLTVYSSPFEL